MARASKECGEPVSAMNLQEVRELRDLNVSLLEDILATFRAVDEYCNIHRIPVAFD